jgi:hypothetical protein
VTTACNSPAATTPTRIVLRRYSKSQRKHRTSAVFATKRYWKVSQLLLKSQRLNRIKLLSKSIDKKPKRKRWKLFKRWRRKSNL